MDRIVAEKVRRGRESIEIELAHLYDDWDEATSELQNAETRSST